MDNFVRDHCSQNADSSVFVSSCDWPICGYKMAMIKDVAAFKNVANLQPCVDDPVYLNDLFRLPSI